MLKLLQQELPKLWTDELYSDEFRASSSRYKDFDHALKHVLKAAVALQNMAEEADHGGQPFKTTDVEKYLADLVISTVRLAIKSPNFPIDLEKAVVDRIERKMGKKIENVPLVEVHGICRGCGRGVPPGFYACNGNGSHSPAKPSYGELTLILKKIPTSEIASWSGMTFDEASAFMNKLR